MRRNQAQTKTNATARYSWLAILGMLLLAVLSQTRWAAQAQQAAEEQAGPSISLAQVRAESAVALAVTAETPTETNPNANLLASANFLVDRLTDNNPGGGGEGAGFVGDLRFCLTQANTLGGTNTIDFLVGGVINLAGALPAINNHLTINGLGANVLTVRRDTGGDYRIFTINSNWIVNISGLTITKGRAVSAPGVFGGGGGLSVNSGATLNLSNSVVTDNEGYSFGGGILASGALNINNCTISYNKAGNGGGFYILFTTANISNSTINNNTTTFQAGVGIQDSTVVISNCTITENSSTNGGTGIVSRGVFGTAATTVINSTVTDNNGPGAGLWALNLNTGQGASITLKNTLVAGNSPQNFTKSGANASLVSQGHNFDSDGTSNFVNGVNGDQVGSLAAPFDPLLGPLANNGGATQTRALLCGSPAINLGDNNGAPAKDQRGVARPVGGTVDIGAFESAQICLGPLADAQAGVAYSAAVTVVGCSGPYNFSLIQGNLPPGFTLNPTTGVVSGLANVVGNYNFTIKVTGSQGCSGTRSYALAVTCPLVTVKPLSLPDGSAGVAYNQTVTASPVGGNYSYSVVAGALPAGLTLNPATGKISGTPTLSGTFGFVIQAKGFGNCPATRSYSVTIATPVCAAITLPAFGNGQVGQNFYGDLSTITPIANYSLAVTAGTLPPGLALDGMFQAVLGVPTQAGTYNFTITATHSSGCTGSKNYTVVVAP